MTSAQVPSVGADRVAASTHLVRWLDRLDPVELVTRLTLVALVLASHYEPVVLVAVAITTVVAFAQPLLLRHPVFWLVGATALLAWQLPQWHTLDDHVLVATWWVLGIGCCLLTSGPEASLRSSGRWMIGLVFGLAVAWKLGSDDFRSGRFFEHALLLDGRFGFVADWLGGVPESTRVANSEAVHALVREPSRWVLLESGNGVGPLAAVFTIWGIFIEGSIAATWLLPLRPRWRWLRHATLLSFIGTTYLVVPVGGFGCILMAMAVTQDDDLPWLRRVYAVAFVALMAYGPIWAAVFAR